MTTIYNDGDFNKIRTQKQRAFQVFLGVTAAYLAFCIGWLIYYVSLPYADPMQTLPKVCVYVASALYVIFVFPFMGIKYHRIRRYYKMIYYLSEGLKNAEENYFVGFERKELQKDYVDVISCVFKTWNRKKSEWMEREAYLDSEKAPARFPQRRFGKIYRPEQFYRAVRGCGTRRLAGRREFGRGWRRSGRRGRRERRRRGCRSGKFGGRRRDGERKRTDKKRAISDIRRHKCER